MFNNFHIFQYAMAITDWPENERPREKLLSRGATALSDAELLALFLRVGVRGKSAVDLARDLLGHFGSLTRLCAAQPEELIGMPGMGPAKYAQLQAVMELARRALSEQIVLAGDIFNAAETVKDWLRLAIGGLPHETFRVLLLDARHRLIDNVELFRGTLTQTSVYPREVVKLALSRNAAAVIFAHNHPSGVHEPSHADEQLTRTLRQALTLVDIRVLDHLIITAHNAAFSFAERGLL